MSKQLRYIILLTVCSKVIAQNKSNKGIEFWLGYGNSISFDINDYNGINTQEQVLHISAEEAATVTVSVNGTSWSQVNQHSGQQCECNHYPAQDRPQ